MSNENWRKKFDNYKPKNNIILDSNDMANKKHCIGFTKCNHDKCLFTKEVIRQCIYYSGSKDNIESCAGKCGK